MGTTFRIVLYAADEPTAQRAADAAFQRVKQLDDVMSDYKDTSELMVLCRQAGSEPVAVSQDLFSVLERGQELACRTDGAFDVTVGPISRLWRRSRRQKELPTPQRLAEALALVGHDKLLLDPKKRTAQLTKKGMLFDLGGIAKGYAADEAQSILKKHGSRSALVAAGGDIVVSDPPPGAKSWAVGIAPLESPDRPPTRTLQLANAAVSTSGDAEQFVEIAGKRYSHILDPKTGLGLQGHSSVTVIAPNGTASDSLATAVSVLGPKKGLELIDATEGAACLILEATPKGQVTHESKRWRMH
jgi:thiamine biosynthesis lipoprotein